MFVYNLKFRKSNLVKTFLLIISILILLLFLFSFYKVFKSINPKLLVTDSIDLEILEISPENYTNVLKSVYSEPSSYIGQKIHFTGYVYRLNDFSQNQFVLARDMIIDSSLQTVVVGFLCEYNTATSFNTNTWVNITGTIQEGFYKNKIPIIKIEKMEVIEKPNETTVYPPNDTYIPTSTIF